MSNYNAKELLEKYNLGNCTEDEKAIVESWFLNLKDEGSIPEQKKIENTSSDIWSSLPIRNNVRRLSIWPRIAAAASIVLAISAGIYFLRSGKPVEKPQLVNDIAPGTNRLVLTLSNGKKIDLTAAKNGKLAMQGQTAISKVANGQIIYVAPVNSSNDVAYNTVSAPRGGQGALTLSDGTQIWLNSSSSITFPTVFKGDKRLITITGEVAIKPHFNAKMPFYAMARGQMSKDIGTDFDINAYDDEPVVKTTLLEGSVQITANGKSVILKPGQQSVLNGNKLNVQAVDTDEAFAWRNGKFLFSSTPLENIMRQVSRWYDVDVVYQDDAVKLKPFSAISTRFANASQVLHDLELTGEVKFKIEGKRITVLDK